MFLEDFDNNDIGITSLYLTNNEKNHHVKMLFHSFCNNAYRYTSIDIAQFENAMTNNLLGQHSIEACNFWFLAIESYINTILKVLCFDKNSDFNQYVTKSLSKRISSINQFLGIQHSEFCKNFQQARLNEFEEYRNEIFHDRNLGKKKKFNKTSFSETPNIPSFASEIQALLISLDLFEYYRYSLPEIDLMPSIVVAIDNTFVFEKLDVLYNKILKPTFESSLTKHGIQTKIDLRMLNKHAVEYALKNYKVIPLIKAENQIINLNQDNTTYYKDNLSLYHESININKKNFGIPKYMR